MILRLGSPSHSESSTIRTVRVSEWKRVENDWQYEIRAEAFFISHGAQAGIRPGGSRAGKCTKEAVVNALERPQSKNEIPAGLAPAHGLTLVQVSY